MISRQVTRVPLMVLIVALLLSVSQTLSGQAVNGTLLGTVNDTTGAAVSNAKIVATQTAMGAIHETMTNESGNYTFPDMQPGPYRVTVESAGFKKAVQENIVLVSNSSIRVDMELQTGNVTETIQVTTAPPLLQTDRADITTKIETEQVLTMPLGTNRNFQSLINLVPGAAPRYFSTRSFLMRPVHCRPRSTVFRGRGTSIRLKAWTTTSALAFCKLSFLRRSHLCR